jgi:hypothetical protein
MRPLDQVVDELRGVEVWSRSKLLLRHFLGLFDDSFFPDQVLAGQSTSLLWKRRIQWLSINPRNGTASTNVAVADASFLRPDEREGALRWDVRPYHWAVLA